MAHCSKYMKRFKKALEHRKLPFPVEIINELAKRAKSDGELDSIINRVVDILEPPSCQKTHCPKFTTYGFANCSDGLVPGRCKLNIEYLVNKLRRENNKWDKRKAVIPGKYFPISDEIKERILAMTDKQWEDQIKKFQKELTGKTKK